jgi:hypothetical protein
MGAGSVNSISSEHHDQGSQPNGNQEHRPIHEASPLRVYLHRQTYALARFRLYDGSRSVMSNKQWQRELARIYRSTSRIMVTQQGARTSVEARCHCFDASVQSQLLVNLPPYSCPPGAYSHEIEVVEGAVMQATSRCTIAALLAVMLASCAWQPAPLDHSHALSDMADRAASDSAKCQSSGAPLGSQAYSQCRALLEDRMSIGKDAPPDRGHMGQSRNQ